MYLVSMVFSRIFNRDPRFYKSPSSPYISKILELSRIFWCLSKVSRTFWTFSMHSKIFDCNWCLKIDAFLEWFFKIRYLNHFGGRRPLVSMILSKIPKWPKNKEKVWKVWKKQLKYLIAVAKAQAGCGLFCDIKFHYFTQCGKTRNLLKNHFVK